MQIQRRSLLAGLAAATFCPICWSRGVLADEAHWTYQGSDGPDHWGDLESDFKSCSLGTQQSPINLARPIHADLENLEITWPEVPLNVTNNGHTIQVKILSGGTISEGAGEKYRLVQFHFHHPSEHLVDGKAHPLEIHFVHLNKTSDSALVLGVFVVAGAANPALAQIFGAMPKEAGEIKTGQLVNPNQLLPPKLDRYRYEGSLTTPPCSEIIQWNVLRDPITASADQIEAFAALFANNARPALPLNRRFLLSSF